MSTGIDDSSNDDNSISIGVQLFAATRAGNLENIRALLSKKKGKRRAVYDYNIRDALYVAARGGRVEIFRILWGKLSRGSKQKYLNPTIDEFGLLHAAVNSGHLEFVRLFIIEFKMNINQENCHQMTPLCYAAQGFGCLETARFLLENGANVDLDGEYGPLRFAVNTNNTDVARLLLVEYHANPNLNQSPVDEEKAARLHFQRNTDLAIMRGKSTMLRMLLKHGAFIGFVNTSRGSNLNSLFRDPQISLKRQLTICRILLEHAQNDLATSEFLRLSFESALKLTQNEGCRILLKAGFVPSTDDMYSAIHHENLVVCKLLVRNQVDPFLQHENEEDENDDETAVSPFLAAARLTDTSIFEYFLGIWNDRFASTGRKNGDGDYPIHVVCCDPHVSLQAIALLVNRHPDALAVVDGEQGLLPFHFAANWGASLDVIFYLLQHCPDALRHVGNPTASGTNALRHAENAAASGGLSDVDDDGKQDTPSRPANVCEGPVKKKIKTSREE